MSIEFGKKVVKEYSARDMYGETAFVQAACLYALTLKVRYNGGNSAVLTMYGQAVGDSL